MGADLIVFIAKGPVKFTKANIKKAEAYAEKVIDYASGIYEALSKEDNEENLTPKEQELVDNGLSHTLMQGFNDQEQYSSAREAIRYLENIAASTAKEEVEKFVSWWTSCSGRDTSGRPDPDDKKQQIVVCGDMSWGDAPEGLGYTTMNRAYWFNIPQNLGVR